MGVKLKGFPTRQRKKAIGETISIKNHPTFYSFISCDRACKFLIQNVRR
jgi:hypothetical protein